jgi:ankyrin repeat protein
LASEEGEIEIVRALVQAGAGADVHKYDEFGANPMIRACEEQHFEVFRALVEAGGDVNKLDSRGFTALHHASGSGLSEGVRYLCLERKADVDKRATDDDGYTPLIFASARGHIEAVRALLEAGADVNKRASDGYETPLSLAFKMDSWRPEQYKQDNTKIAALLREAGAQDLEDY